jgi:hypothetical protein
MTPKSTRQLVFLAAMAIPNESLFKPDNTTDGIEVSFASTEAPNKWVRGIGKVKASCDTVFAVLSDVESYSKVFSTHLSASKVLATSENKKTVYLLWPLSFPMSDRDAVVDYLFDAQSKTVAWQSAAHPQDPAKALRIQEVHGITKLQSVEPGQCQIDYIYYGDLGGDLAGWIKERAWREEPVVYIKAIDKVVVGKS